MKGLIGLGRLVRFVVRRDRVRLSVWVVSLLATIGLSAWSMMSVYPDQRSIDAYARMFGDNPALTAFAGPGYGFDHPNIGVVLVNEVQLWGAIAMALMSIFMLTRHTRAEEDSERAELVRSNPVGRHAPGAASILVLAFVNVVVGVALALSFSVMGYPTVGSWSLAGSMAMVGLVFVGITAIAAQVMSTGRGTLVVSTGVLIVAFVLRALGDMAGSALVWASPIGWGQSVRAYADERWWPLGLCAVVAGALVIVSFVVADHRDLGAGLLAPRHGSTTASRALVHPVGFVARQQRGAVVAWMVGLFVTGAVFGSIAHDIDLYIEANPDFADIFAMVSGADLTSSFFAAGATMLGLVAGGYAVAAALGPYHEEHAGRAESLLAAPLGRSRWAGAHVLVAVAGSVLTVAAGGLGVGVTYAANIGEPGEVLRQTGVALVTLPAVLIYIGLTMLVYGLWPRRSMLAWAPYSVTAVIVFFGELLQLPDWVRHLSPFEYLPAVPAESLDLLPLLVELGVGTVLVGAGMWALQRRDIATT